MKRKVRPRLPALYCWHEQSGSSTACLSSAAFTYLYATPPHTCPSSPYAPLALAASPFPTGFRFTRTPLGVLTLHLPGFMDLEFIIRLLRYVLGWCLPVPVCHVAHHLPPTLATLRLPHLVRGATPHPHLRFHHPLHTPVQFTPTTWVGSCAHAHTHWGPWVPPGGATTTPPHTPDGPHLGLPLVPPPTTHTFATPTTAQPSTLHTTRGSAHTSLCFPHTCLPVSCPTPPRSSTSAATPNTRVMMAQA